MATSTIPLPAIDQNWYMSWYMATQAANQICVTLSDSVVTYVNNACRQSTSFGVLSQGFDLVAGTSVQIAVDVPNSSNIRVQNQPVVVPNSSGTTIAQGYVLCYEDSGDQDFNDLYVSIMAWRSKG
ncbi:MAG: hypothetical protein AAGG07_02645 [Planctomycetota bacterium]